MYDEKKIPLTIQQPMGGEYGLESMAAQWNISYEGARKRLMTYLRSNFEDLLDHVAKRPWRCDDYALSFINEQINEKQNQPIVYPVSEEVTRLQSQVTQYAQLTFELLSVINIYSGKLGLAPYQIDRKNYPQIPLADKMSTQFVPVPDAVHLELPTPDPEESGGDELEEEVVASDQEVLSGEFADNAPESGVEESVQQVVQQVVESHENPDLSDSNKGTTTKEQPVVEPAEEQGRGESSGELTQNEIARRVLLEKLNKTEGWFARRRIKKMLRELDEEI